jgi:hypothetical protein
MILIAALIETTASYFSASPNFALNRPAGEPILYPQINDFLRMLHSEGVNSERYNDLFI